MEESARAFSASTQRMDSSLRRSSRKTSAGGVWRTREGGRTGGQTRRPLLSFRARRGSGERGERTRRRSVRLVARYRRRPPSGTRHGVERTSSEPMVADARAARDRGREGRGATRGRESNPARARGRSALLVRLRASAETSRSARTGATRAIAKVGGGGRASIGRDRRGGRQSVDCQSCRARLNFYAARGDERVPLLGACADSTSAS